MATLQENKTGYASPAQREVLIQLAKHPFLQKDFFLTGIKENPSLWPQTHIPVDQQDFFIFYENISKWIYGLVSV